VIPRLTRYGAAIAVAFVLMCPAAAGAQDATATKTVDVADLWRLVRKKPPSDPAPDDPGTMRVVAPVIGAKPSAGVMFGAAGNLAFYKGTPDDTRISSVISSVTFSTKQETSIYSRLSIFTNRDHWRLDGDNRAIWGSQNSYGLGTATQSSEAVRTSFNYFRVHATGYRHLGKNVYGGVGLHYDDHSDFGPDDGTDPNVWGESAFVDYSQANGLSLDRQTSAGVSGSRTSSCSIGSHPAAAPASGCCSTSAHARTCAWTSASASVVREGCISRCRKRSSRR
jgi:hypothetical protein